MDNSANESPATTAEKRFLQAPAAARILGMHSTTLVRLAKQGRIPAYAVPGETRTIWLFDVEEIAKTLRMNSTEVITKSRTAKQTFRPALTREKVRKIVQEIRSRR